MSATDYLADYRAAQAGGHHVDCDGWRTAHRVTVRKNEHGSLEAVCEECGKLHVGSFGGSYSEQGVARMFQGHAQEVPCDGRCQAW